MTLFRIASASASNVEVASPDCSVSVGYITKWYFTMLLPFLFLGGFLVGHVFYVAVKLIMNPALRKNTRALNKHVPGVVGGYLLMLNFLYISLTGKAFEALACKSVGFVPVLVVDATVVCTSASYLVMRRWAYIAIVGYGVGVPLIYAVIIFRFSGKMKVDQALRIRGLSGSRATNPFYTMQKRFRRLYFKYKPETYYWTLVIVFRKFVIVLLTAFTGNQPLFAATCITLVLFVAYATHVRLPRTGTREGDGKGEEMFELLARSSCVWLVLLGPTLIAADRAVCAPCSPLTRPLASLCTD
jgi:hypothetical protein